MAVKRLIEGFEPESYELVLKPDREKMTFEGTVSIRGRKKGRPSQRFTLHQKDLKVKSAKIKFLDKKHGQTDIDVSRLNKLNSVQELRIHSLKTMYPGEYILEIVFSGIINEEMHGMYASVYGTGKSQKKIISTQLESHHAREVFPCIDEPSAKAVFKLTLVTPDEVVISNTPISNQRTEDNLLITEFEPTPRMSTYLVAFAFGRLVYKEAATDSGVTVRSYATPSNTNLLDFSVKTAVRAVEFFEDYFGFKYPLSKLDMLAVPEFSSGAMENWGLITYRESCMLVDEKTSNVDSIQFAAIIICHEIAHHWFGNLVTMEWWDELWLKESFANLMEYRAVDELFPDWHIWEQFTASELSSAMRRDSLPNVQPIRQDITHPDEITTLFDPSIVYAKGSAVLHMLMHKIGEESFRKGLNDYFKKYAYQNTTGRHLWECLGQAAGQDLSSFMEAWLSKPGFPYVRLDYLPGGPMAEISQSRLIAGSPAAETSIWPVPLAASARTTPETLEAEKSAIEIANSDKPLIFNHLARSYYAVSYHNYDHFTSILSAVNQAEIEPIDRLFLLNSYSLLERALLVPTTDNLDLLLAYKNERHDKVWGAMTAIIGNVRRLVIATPGEENIKSLAASIALPLAKEIGWDGRQGDNSHTKRLRDLVMTVAAAAEAPEIVEEGLRRFAIFAAPGDLSSDIRGAVYFIGARYGTKKDFEKLLDLYKAVDNADEKEEISAALAATKDEAQIQTLLRTMQTPVVRLQDLSSWFGHLISNPYARDMTWDWLVGNWEWLDKRYGGDRSQHIFPRYAASAFSKDAELKNFVKFFEPMKSNKLLERSIVLGIEEITSRIQWRRLNEEAAIKWLSDWRSRN